MTATVRLDERLEKRLENLAALYHKKKSEIIREAIEYYADSFEKKQKKRMFDAVSKTRMADKKEYEAMEGTIDDGL